METLTKVNQGRNWRVVWKLLHLMQRHLNSTRAYLRTTVCREASVTPLLLFQPITKHLCNFSWSFRQTVVRNCAVLDVPGVIRLYSQLAKQLCNFTRSAVFWLVEIVLEFCRTGFLADCCTLLCILNVFGFIVRPLPKITAEPQSGVIRLYSQLAKQLCNFTRSAIFWLVEIVLEFCRTGFSADCCTLLCILNVFSFIVRPVLTITAVPQRVGSTDSQLATSFYPVRRSTALYSRAQYCQ